MKYLKIIFLVLIVFSALYFVIDRALPYIYNFGHEQFSDYYWPNRWWLLGHLLGGMTAILIGPFQFVSKFRNRYLKTHRLMGKIYIIAIIIGSLCAFYMSFTVALQVNIAWSIALFFLALPWLISVLMAYRMVRLKRIPQHREWMIRSYALSLFFMTFSFWVDGLASTGLPESVSYPLGVFLGWSLNLLIAETWIRRSRMRVVIPYVNSRP